MSLGRPTLTPDGSTLVLAGSVSGQFGSPGFVKGFDPANGSELWSVDLPFQLNPGYRIYGTHHPRITSDGLTAYVSTHSLIEWPLESDHAFLYAIDISAAGCQTREVDAVSYDPDKVTMHWTSLGPAGVYDVARGDLDQLRSGPGATCMQSGISQTFYEDPSMPAPGAGYYYLVRGSTECGTGPWGSDSSGQGRNVDCP